MLTGPDHVARYQETDGREGHYWDGACVLLLTTMGRRTGFLRTTPVVYARSGEQYLIVASNAGRARPPTWYLNLLAQPKVGVQVGAEKFSARARVATESERPPLWSAVVAARPRVAEYQERTDRLIPVVILERLG
jgi:deazaflavin-dependent oxidoreductase (nitroreductase family)